MEKTRRNKFGGRRIKESVANLPVPDTLGSLWYNRARITQRGNLIRLINPVFCSGLLSSTKIFAFWKVHLPFAHLTDSWMPESRDHGVSFAIVQWVPVSSAFPLRILGLCSFIQSTILCLMPGDINLFREGSVTLCFHPSVCFVTTILLICSH